MPDQQGAIIQKTVSMIYGDKNDRIWIAVESQGLFCYDLRNEKLKNYKFKNQTSNVTSFNIDNSGRMWIGFYGDQHFY